MQMDNDHKKVRRHGHGPFIVLDRSIPMPNDPQFMGAAYAYLKKRVMLNHKSNCICTCGGFEMCTWNVRNKQQLFFHRSLAGIRRQSVIQDQTQPVSTTVFLSPLVDWYIKCSRGKYMTNDFLSAELILPRYSLSGYTGTGTFRSCSCFISLWMAWSLASPNTLSPLFVGICAVWQNINPSM